MRPFRKIEAWNKNIVDGGPHVGRMPLSRCEMEERPDWESTSWKWLDTRLTKSNFCMLISYRTSEGFIVISILINNTSRLENCLHISQLNLLPVHLAPTGYAVSFPEYRSSCHQDIESDSHFSHTRDISHGRHQTNAYPGLWILTCTSLSTR